MTIRRDEPRRHAHVDLLAMSAITRDEVAHLASLTRIETVFVPTSPEWSFLASSLVKEVAAFGGDVSGLVPDFVLGPMLDKLAQRPVE